MTQTQKTFFETRRYTLEIQRPVDQGLLVHVQQEGNPAARTFSDEQTLLNFVSRLLRGPGGLR